MDRSLLKVWLEEGMSLNEIAALTDRDSSTVGYWVAKHGLEANGRRKYAGRGGLRRQQLEPLVDRGATLREIAEELDRSISTVRHWLRKHGLATKRHHRGRPALSAAAEAAGERRFVSQCARHGETDFLVLGGGRSRCARCSVEAVSRKRRAIKATLVSEAGGRCAICGYKKHPAALQFHHLDRAEKRFGVASAGYTRSLARAREEAAKCVLLCANCHAEVEVGAAIVPLE